MFRLSLILAISLLGFGCSHKRTTAELIKDSRAEITPHKERLNFALRDTVEAYLQSGSRNALWDETVTNALTAVSKSRVALSGPEGGALRRTAALELQKAIDAGCKDPLVVYFWTWIKFPNSNNVDQQGKDAWVYAANIMRTSQYSPLRRCWAYIHAARAANALAQNGKTPQEAHELRHEVGDLFPSVLSDKSIPPEEALTLCWYILDTMRYNTKQLKYYFDLYEPFLKKSWSRYADSWFIRGDFEVDFAWASRGGGFANTVTKDGWKGFAEHLALAEKYLLKSWDMHPMEKTAVRLITLEIGQGKGRARMEKFFNWAMTLNPNSTEACNKKLYYLYPKWYGSPEELMQFGWECITSTNWGGEVPLTIIYAHDELAAEYYPNREERDAYWKLPAVWPGIDAAFTKFFKSSPNATGWHHNYFWYAVKCQQWKTANRELALLGPVNYSYFGGKDEFEKMVSETKKHAQPIDPDATASSPSPSPELQKI